MRLLKIDPTIIVDFYFKEIRSLCEMASPVFHSGLTKKQSNDIESIQNNLVKNPCFCMYPHPPSVGGASNVIIQMAAIIWISTILAHYTQINMFIQLDDIVGEPLANDI